MRTAWHKSAVNKAERPLSETGLLRSKWAYEMIPQLIKSGINIMAGTDMPLSLLTPGYSLHEELSLLVQCGLTTMQALESATLKPAQYYGVENQQGSIAAGMKADMVILDANPLDNISNTLQINAVMRNGFLHTKADLDNIFKHLEKYGEFRKK